MVIDTSIFIEHLRTKDSHLVSYDDDHYLIKEEMTHYGENKLILKHKITGKIVQKIIGA